MKRATVFFMALLCTLLFVGCGKDSKSYFPLSEGEEWKYQVSVKQGGAFGLGGNASIEMTVTNLAARELKGEKVVPQKAGTSDSSSFSFYFDDKDCIYEVASQGPGDIEPKIKEQAICLIKFPIEAGKEWKDKSETSLLSRKIPISLVDNVQDIVQ